VTVNIVFKIHYMLIVKYVSMISHDKIFGKKSLCRKKIEGYMLICQNTEGVHVQRKVGNPFSKT